MRNANYNTVDDTVDYIVGSCARLKETILFTTVGYHTNPYFQVDVVILGFFLIVIDARSEISLCTWVSCHIRIYHVYNKHPKNSILHALRTRKYKASQI